MKKRVVVWFVCVFNERGNEGLGRYIDRWMDSDEWIDAWIDR